VTSEPMRDLPSWARMPINDRDEVLRMLSLGQNVTAIRYYRQAAGLGLAESKDAIDLLLAHKAPRPIRVPTKPFPNCGQRLRTALASPYFSPLGSIPAGDFAAGN
jgi:hypothetical protein